jgi:hypothetical protein
MIKPGDPTGPKRDRVAPEIRLIATPARGPFFGDRGCLHNRAGLAPGGGSSALFFLDAATRWRKDEPPEDNFDLLKERNWTKFQASVLFVLLRRKA